MFATLLARLRRRHRSAPVDSYLPTHVKRLESPFDRLSAELTLVTRLQPGDHVLCVAGEVMPCDGVVAYGCAVVQETLPTGARRERSVSRGTCVMAGQRVVEDFLVFCVAGAFTV